MSRTRLIAAALLVAALLRTAAAQDQPDAAPPPRALFQPISYEDVPGFRSVRNALAADKKEFSDSMPKSIVPAGYLGVVFTDKSGKTVIGEVASESPAEKAGLKAGDVLQEIDDKPCPSATFARDQLRAKLAGAKVNLAVQRDGKDMTITAMLKPTSSPIVPTGANAGRPIIGAMLDAPATGSGVQVKEVTDKGPAANAGLKEGDVILKFDGKDVTGTGQFRGLIAERRVGDQVELLVERNGERLGFKPILAAEAAGGTGIDNRLGGAWRKPTYHLAIIGVEYKDVKHESKIGDDDWAESMFGTKTYTGKSATGQKVYGSMNDYYRDLSFGKFHIEGKFLGWADLPKKRMDYSSNSGGDPKEKSEFLNGAMDRCLEKFGKTALDGYDGVFFIYAGGRVSTTRGGLYWPHRSSFNHAKGGKRWPYFIVNELVGGRMNDISVFCHEFGHMLGLPDLYARQENPGDEGVGVWCAMSQQGGDGRPQHFSAWCKEQLGWITPTMIDPRVPQKLVLAPIEDDPTQCFKVMVRPDGSEYFLLENRKKKGWDESLPAEGLLVWRVVKRPGGDFRQLGAQPVFLEEAHGIEGAGGPNLELKSVPFPSAQNDSFTPFTTPSSRSQLGGGLPVYITNIRRLPDGRITFHIGYEYQ